MRILKELKDLHLFVYLLLKEAKVLAMVCSFLPTLPSYPKTEVAGALPVVKKDCKCDLANHRLINLISIVFQTSRNCNAVDAWTNVMYLGRDNTAFGKCSPALKMYWSSLKVLRNMDKGLVQFV